MLEYQEKTSKQRDLAIDRQAWRLDIIDFVHL
jgi:hypothetical protein